MGLLWVSSLTSGPVFFFFNATPTTEIYTLSLHDALPIWPSAPARTCSRSASAPELLPFPRNPKLDRKSTRLNSSHTVISYAVFCLKKKNIALPQHTELWFIPSDSLPAMYTRTVPGPMHRL